MQNPLVSAAISHLLLRSLDLSAEEIPGINTALSEFYSRLAPWIPCQLLLVLHFRYSNSSVKTNPGGKLLGPWAELGSDAWSQPVGRPWCESTGISWCSAVGGAGTARRLQHCIPMSQPWAEFGVPSTEHSLQAELHLPMGVNHIHLIAGPGQHRAAFGHTPCEHQGRGSSFQGLRTLGCPQPDGCRMDQARSV